MTATDNSNIEDAPVSDVVYTIFGYALLTEVQGDIHRGWPQLAFCPYPQRAHSAERGV